MVLVLGEHSVFQHVSCCKCAKTFALCTDRTENKLQHDRKSTSISDEVGSLKINIDSPGFHQHLRQDCGWKGTGTESLSSQDIPYPYKWVGSSSHKVQEFQQVSENIQYKI